MSLRTADSNEKQLGIAVCAGSPSYGGLWGARKITWAQELNKPG